jgi:cytochrome P450
MQDPMLNAAFSETLRLQANGLSPRAIEHDTTVSALGQTYSFRKGETVIINMAGVHKNPNNYESPEEFRLTRFMNASYDSGNAKVLAKDGSQLKVPYMPWGGGQHMVPNSFSVDADSLVHRTQIRCWRSHAPCGNNSSAI